MSRIAMRGPLTILHVSQPTDGGVGKYIEDAVADQVRRGWHVLVASPSYDDLASRIEAAGARHVEWTASRAPGPGSLLDTLHARPNRQARAACARPPALVEGRARRAARDPRPTGDGLPAACLVVRGGAGPGSSGDPALGAARGTLGDRDRLRQRGRAATGRGARRRGELRA